MHLDLSLAVLVVDDTDDHSRLMCAVLKRIGYENVEIARNGKEALEKLRLRRFAIVISDWNMEPLNGFELLTEIRADNQLAKIRFIMVSGESDISHVVAAKKAKANSYLVKPFSSHALRQKIEEAFASPVSHS